MSAPRGEEEEIHIIGNLQAAARFPTSDASDADVFQNVLPTRRISRSADADEKPGHIITVSAPLDQHPHSLESRPGFKPAVHRNRKRDQQTERAQQTDC
jgi:hypothetical protein